MSQCHNVQLLSPSCPSLFIHSLMVRNDHVRTRERLSLLYTEYGSVIDDVSYTFLQILLQSKKEVKNAYFVDFLPSIPYSRRATQADLILAECHYKYLECN